LLVLYTAKILDQDVLSIKNLMPNVQVLKLVMLVHISARIGRKHYVHTRADTRALLWDKTHGFWSAIVP